MRTQYVFRHWLSAGGVALAAASAVLFAVLYGVELMGFISGPYVGIIAFVILPTAFVVGLALVPVGLWKDRVKRRRAAAKGSPLPEFPVLDFNRAGVRGAALSGLGALGLTAIILSVGTYKGVETLHSTEFCATGCHGVMTPEFAAYQRSPHAAVACSECHVGPGVGHFVTSKLTGVRQLVDFTLNRYQRPVRPPHDLRAAPQTCGQCHSPTRAIGDKLKMRASFSDDEANTEKHTVMMMHVGGPDTQG
ncbi:MAG TPA: NapC/NirT family cytochrome c, partial [Myxococcales bacterium]|nr:NapC/NirT family cytochrome c [Myxococcales bacterium]